MLPFLRFLHKPVFSHITPSSPVEALDAASDDAPAHLDYDFQPTNVDGLAHYIDSQLEGDRFHIS